MINKEASMPAIVRIVRVVLGVSAVSLATAVGAASAEPALLKAAKDAGLPAQNCRYCHTVAMPKKDGFKPEDLNERGKWLAAEKAKRTAAKSDAAWLKDYPGGPEQK
jgi:hypothetical protein